MILTEAPIGPLLHVLGARGGAAPQTRRLAELGVRPGVRLRVVARTSGGGALLGIGDDRLAVAKAILAGVEVERVEDAPSDQAASELPTGPAGASRG